MSFRLSSCKEYHRCQNSLNKDFACRSMGPGQEPRLVPGVGRELSFTKTQVATQGALSCISSAVVVSNLFGRMTSSKSMIKKICIYAKETHFPRLASGYTYSRSGENIGVLQLLYNVSNIESGVSGKNKTPFPCTKGRIV